jgi:hypothetical protein
MKSLMNAPGVILKLILNLCTVSITMCNKLFNRMTPFNWDKVSTRVTVKAGVKTFSWLFNTGAAATCMNLRSHSLVKL